MFESVIRAVLNKFLGDYVANLEANQLNVGIFSGTFLIVHFGSLQYYSRQVMSNFMVSN